MLTTLISMLFSRLKKHNPFFVTATVIQINISVASMIVNHRRKQTAVIASTREVFEEGGHDTIA